MKKLNIITLGCSKNLVDSEHLAGRAEKSGWEVVFDGDLDFFYDTPRLNDDRDTELSALNRSRCSEARTVVVNTCGFIGDAKQESIDTILELVAAKTRGEIDRLYVIGCLSERYADELRAELPEVDGFFGARGIDGIAAELETEGASHVIERVVWHTDKSPSKGMVRPSASDEAKQAPSRKLSTPNHYAYLKISEGCDRKCGFCAIPLIRGRHISVPLEELIYEAQQLAANGVRELIVIAQDITLWGVDLYGERRLAALLKGLAKINGIEWIRLHYGYPAGFPDDVIALMAAEPKICKYLDIPLQHIADSQLTAMKRGLGSEGTRLFVKKLRAEVPGVALRTTMLVGYPGETEADFEELLDFIKEARFERLGVFPYSAEEGTFSGDTLADNISDDIKQQRVDRLMSAQATISAQINEARIGTIERVVVDRREGDFWVCRSQWDSPEVDTEILVSEGDLSPGQFVDVRIVSADEYDLMAEIKK